MKRLKVMKKSIIALTVMSFAAIMLFSCAENETDFQVTKLQKGDFAISIAGTQTRSEAVTFDEETNLITFETEEGTELAFEESVIDLNAPGIVTRGTPAYTENITSLADYKSFNAVIYSGTSEKYPLAPFKLDESDANSRYIRHLYVADPFDGCDPMSLYMWMPTNMTNKGVTFGDDAYGVATNGDLTITFDYEGGESVGTAAKQQDILFSTRKITGEQYDAALKTTVGAPGVLFFHALTGVKFAISNSQSSTDNIAITEIVFKGLKDKGNCVVTPVKEDNYTDNTTTYSSGLSTVVNWTPDANTPVSNYSNNTGYSQTYGSTDVQDWSTKPTGSNFPDDFYGDKNGGKQNLNTKDAEYTFWLMPQAITANVTLTITYTVNGGTPQTYTVNYGEILAANNVVWKAGELRTYSIRIDDVNVMIDDDVTIEGPKEVDIEGSTDKLQSYKGSTKTNVEIQNTGNTDVYIRAALIGQWLDEESDDPVFGYTDFTSGQFVSVDSWYQDVIVNKTNKQGSFTGLPGTNWELHDDGFYYYKEPVAPGKIIGTAPTGASNAGDYLGNPLFTTYEVGDAPASAVAGQVKQIYFQLEIATQAISAMKADGTHYTLKEAWAKANTPDPQEP